MRVTDQELVESFFRGGGTNFRNLELSYVCCPDLEVPQIGHTILMLGLTTKRD